MLAPTKWRMLLYFVRFQHPRLLGKYLSLLFMSVLIQSLHSGAPFLRAQRCCCMLPKPQSHHNHYILTPQLRSCLQPQRTPTNRSELFPHPCPYGDSLSSAALSGWLCSDLRYCRNPWKESAMQRIGRAMLCKAHVSSLSNLR